MNAGSKARVFVRPTIGDERVWIRKCARVAIGYRQHPQNLMPGFQGLRIFVEDALIDHSMAVHSTFAIRKKDRNSSFVDLPASCTEGR
jgi:hypothetical protein